jgi:uncharacterized protein (DUF4213/DUF364 family)
MLRKGEILRRLFDVASKRGIDAVIEDVRIGLGYVAVKLSGGCMGLAALLLYDLPPGCSVYAEAGKVGGSPISSLLVKLVEGTNPLEKALGLAAANAVLSAGVVPDGKDSLSIINLAPEDRVAMVGLFTPMVPKVEATGAELSIIGRNPARMEIPKKKEAARVLKECTVAIITATALLNDTMEEVLDSLGKPRHVAVLGPSTPLLGEIFNGAPVNHLGGAVVRDAKKVMQIVSEGGGTPAMRPYLGFVNLLINGMK